MLNFGEETLYRNMLYLIPLTNTTLRIVYRLVIRL